MNYPVPTGAYLIIAGTAICLMEFIIIGLCVMVYYIGKDLSDDR
jgi:hypothetical protein